MLSLLILVLAPAAVCAVCIRSPGELVEVRDSKVDCLGGDVHLETEGLAVGIAPSGCIGSSSRYRSVDGQAWDSAPLGAAVDHDLDGMEQNFKGDFFTLGSPPQREGNIVATGVRWLHKLTILLPFSITSLHSFSTRLLSTRGV